MGIVIRVVFNLNARGTDYCHTHGINHTKKNTNTYANSD